MSYQILILARARQDVDDTVAWIYQRSEQGASRWLQSFKEAVARLEDNPLLGPLAIESDQLGEPIRSLMFRTRAGRTYRLLYFVQGQEVRILRVRGPGQSAARKDDLKE